VHGLQQFGLGHLAPPEDGLLSPPAFPEKLPDSFYTLIAMEVTLIVQMAGNLEAAERALAWPFAYPAAQPNGYEICPVVSSLKGRHNNVNGTLRHHLALTQEKVLRIMSLNPPLRGHACFRPLAHTRRWQWFGSGQAGSNDPQAPADQICRLLCHDTVGGEFTPGDRGKVLQAVSFMIQQGKPTAHTTRIASLL
jgi:hypothetical protein